MQKQVSYMVSQEEAEDSRRRFKIPVSILEIVREQNLFSPFRLFMYFKTVSTSGQMCMTHDTILLAAQELEISEKSVRRHLKILRSKNWIGQFKTGGFILRGFSHLQKIEKVGGRTAVWFDKTKHLHLFREFVVSACIGQLVNRQRTRLWREGNLPGSRRGTPNVRKFPLPTSFSMACEAMAKIYKISIGTAFNWKEAAHKAGFIKVEKILRPVLVDNMPEWKRINPDLAHRLIFRNDRYFIQYPDKVQCNLRFSRRRSIESVDKK